MTTLSQSTPTEVRLPLRERVRVRLAGIVVAPVKRRPQRDARLRAVISLAVGCALFFAVQFGLGWAVHTEHNPLRDPIYFDKLALLKKHPAFFAPPGGRSSTVLFLGSSRTLNAVNARAASVQFTDAFGEPVEAFNFGQAGAGPITNAVYLRRLVKEGVKPDFAVIEIHPTFLAGQRPDPPETKWLLPIRLRPDELPVVRAMGFPAAEPAVHGPRGFLAPLYEYRFLTLDRYAPWFLMSNQRLNGGHECDDFGFTRLQEQVNPADKPALLAIAKGQYASYFDGYRPNGCGVNGLRDTIEVCQANGIRPALAMMPESPTWLAWYDAEGLKELKRLADRLGEEYGVPVFDGRTWVPDELTVDGHHVAGPGADMFTKRIVSDVSKWMKR
ncbi:MAG: DUF1574 family protein [Gemmataceae bacterium]